MTRKTWIAAALLWALTGIGAMAQTQTCPRPDCPNQGQCPRNGQGMRNGQGPRNPQCPQNGQCPRNGGQSGARMGYRGGQGNPAPQQGGGK